MTQNSRSLCLIVRKTPSGSFDSWDALRLSLTAYVSGIRCSVIFENQGVFNLLADKRPDTVGGASVDRYLNDLSERGVRLYVSREDLERLGVKESDLMEVSTYILPEEELYEAISRHDAILAF